jgi:lipopolysaccharide/colanic/teichoic acid biosynthesis glycosyltransferase
MTRAKRTLDLVGAGLGVVLLAPLLALLALLVKAEDGGPVLFKQERVGYRGRLFRIWKFRTMVPDAETRGPPLTVGRDPRVTRIGAWMRRLKLDELPQLFNVLKGDMNIVGPRPEQPTIFVYLREQIEGYQRRQRVRPGITGWAQINQGYDTSVDDVRRKVRYDLEYIRRQSALEDLRIMARTLPVMLGRRGAW